MILCIDIGGTIARMGLVDKTGQIHARYEKSVDFDHYKTPLLKIVLEGAREFIQETGAEIEGIGISAAGMIDDRLGVVLGINGRIPLYEGSPLKDAFEAEFHVPTAVLNDANAAALGECFAGRAKGVDNVLLITLRTGVGCGIIINKRVFGGARGMAGEIGHFTLYQDGKPCPCGKRGCFETYASTTALIQEAEEKTGETFSGGKEIFDRAAAGDEALLAVLDHWTDDIAAGLSGLIHIFNPDVVLIAGGVCEQEELLIKPLRRKTHDITMRRFREGLTIDRAILGNDAGLIGAAKFFMDKYC